MPPGLAYDRPAHQWVENFPVVSAAIVAPARKGRKGRMVLPESPALQGTASSKSPLL